jgi:MFS family permease
LISIIIIAFILAIDLPSRGVSWTSPVVVSLLAASAILGLFFLVFEQKYASEPIFPPRLLLQPNVATSYLIVALQTSAQLALMFSIPLYFQVTSGASNAAAGSHLVPAVVGNAIGGLLSGVLIKRTGRYKFLLFFAALSACFCYGLIILTWHGDTSPLASLGIFPGGFGTSMAGSTTFIALMAYIPHKDAAVATGGLYLSQNIGMILGLSVSSSIQRGELRSLLDQRGVKPHVVEDILKDVLYIRQLTGKLRDTVIGSYVDSLAYSHGKHLTNFYDHTSKSMLTMCSRFLVCLLSLDIFRRFRNS